MRKVYIVLMAVIFLAGCKGQDSTMDLAINLRRILSESEENIFQCAVTADYGDNAYTFSLQCNYFHDGSMKFTVNAPESIAGITGSIDSASGKLLFDDHILAFPLLADGYISPVCAPWLLMKTLLGGYIESCGVQEGNICLTINDTFCDEPLTALIWVNEDKIPELAEFIWNGRRILTLQISNFNCV